MAKKRQLLRHGLSSEVFLLAYYIPDSGLGIARRYESIRHGIKKMPTSIEFPHLPQKAKRPANDKISQELKKLVSEGYLVIKNKKYYASAERLVNEIVIRLNLMGIELESNEKIFLNRLLQQNYFFTFTSFDTLSEIGDQPKRIHHVDAINKFCTKIGMMCTLASHSKEKNPNQTHQNSDKSIERINEELEEITESINTKFLKKYKKSIRKRKHRSVSLINSTMKSVVVSTIILDRLPINTLKKFALLWDQHYGFQMGLLMSEFANLNTKSILERLEQIMKDSRDY